MDNPKVSVLIPLYNRKQYAADCINSVLNQTFQDFEILIRDDCSTDGVYEFVATNYAEQISAGKIKLFRNPKNVGEFRTDARLLKDARGKYVMILHNDDMYLPHALQHLCEVAEKTNADVVHTPFFLTSSKSGIINDLKDCQPTCSEKTVVDKVTVMPNEPVFRFSEWINGGTFIDAQYNIFRRQFVIDSELSLGPFGNRHMALWWLMTAKVFVKTPVICYVRRDSPDAQSNDRKFPPEKLETLISSRIKLLRSMDENFAKIDFFKDNEYFQYIAKAHLTVALDNFGIRRHAVFANGLTPELYKVVAKSFKEKFGENYFYPMILFNWVQVMPYNRRVDAINFEHSTPPRCALNNIFGLAA